MDNRKQVRDFINNLVLIPDLELGATFIYRGESECHDRVSSGLFRQVHELGNQLFDITKAQNRQLEMAREYARNEVDPFQLLAQIQHRGGKTNLIDFTSDLNLALFFACNYSPDKDGRIIFFQRRRWDDYRIRPSIQPSNMADAPKSLFVISSIGYIRDEDITVYEIPSQLKAGILRFLKRVYGIEPFTVYNDISGFIRDQEHFPDYEADYYAGQEYAGAGDWNSAIGCYTKYLQNPTLRFRRGLVYFQRGIANFCAGNFSDAFCDFREFDRRNWKGKPELPEPIRSWFREADEAKQKEEERQRELQRESDTETAAETHSIWIETQDPERNLVDRARFKLLVESGYGYSQEIEDGKMRVTLPVHLHGSKCLFWFNMEGYRGVNPVQVQLGGSFTATLKPKKSNPDAPEVTIQVTYEITKAT